MTQIKSRERVSKHGEVFTAEREVKAMLDLVKPETERIDSKFLEPACGNGNFLVEILRRKLDSAKQMLCRWHPCKHDEMMADLTLRAISSIYGIDIMADNVNESRERMYFELVDWFRNTSKRVDLRHGLVSRVPTEELVAAWHHILELNIQQGDFLTMQHPETKEPLKVCEWNIDGQRIEYTDYRLSDLVESNEPRQLMLW
jgi:hypothetical protein